MSTTPGVGPIGLESIQSRIAAIQTRFAAFQGVSTPSSPVSSASGGVRTQSVGGAAFPQVLSQVSAPGRASIAEAIQWGRGEIGTPYAAVNPFRFGDVPWDGGAHLSVNGNGKTYQYPAGTKVYDCSGYVTAVYRQTGLDLAKYGATTSETMGQRIPEVPLAQIQPGDLLIVDSDRDGVADHVELYQGNGRVLEASGAGVQEDAASFSMTMKVVRPSLLEPGLFSGNAMAGSAAGAAANDRVQEILATMAQNRMSVLGLSGGPSS